MTLRIGHGVDAHRLVEGRRLMLGCVAIPHTHGLAGHSDGDAVAHALCDALLGGAGLGDMGTHFPSHEERWRDSSGARFLGEVASLLAASGAEVQSAHAVVVAEAPRLAPHLAAMAAACAEALLVAPAKLTISATSSDGMGFAGRGEGIAVSAVALLTVQP
ncbi:MAG: 2-C-methyl-D-erythritol 2,4-cyclodiphosphate synthase [Candidatus Dormibacteria bacterium]